MASTSTQTITVLPPTPTPTFYSQSRTASDIPLEPILRHNNNNNNNNNNNISGRTLNDTPLSPDNEPLNPPPDLVYDTPQGWPAVMAGSAIFFVYLGLVYSYGIVQLHLNEYRLAPLPTLSFIGSVAACLSPFTCMLVGRLIRLIGYRKTSFIGSFLLGLGEFTAGWATKSVPAMFVTQGFLFGMGGACLFLPAATVPSLWFKRKRGLATGIVYSGGGVGSAVIALSLEKLIDVAGLETALKALGAAAWVICFTASYFLTPPPVRRAETSMHWKMFRSRKFFIMALMGTIATFPLFVPPFLLPLYAASIGASKQAGAAILASWNIASALGRIGMGFGADTALGPVNSMLASLTLIGVTSMALWPFASSIGMIIFFAILNGIGSGGFFSLMPVVTGAVFGDGQLTSMLPMLTTTWTLSYFLGAPIAGYLLEAYGGSEAGLAAYRPAMFYAGSLTLTSAGLILAVRLMMNRKIFARV